MSINLGELICVLNFHSSLHTSNNIEKTSDGYLNVTMQEALHRLKFPQIGTAKEALCKKKNRNVSSMVYEFTKLYKAMVHLPAVMADFSPNETRIQSEKVSSAL